MCVSNVSAAYKWTWTPHNVKNGPYTDFASGADLLPLSQVGSVGQVVLSGEEVCGCSKKIIGTIKYTNKFQCHGH